MIDTDNTLFQITKAINDGQQVPTGAMNDLERRLKQFQRQNDHLQAQQDQLGILSGGVQQKYRNTQRLNKIKNQVDGALESLEDIKQMQIANLKNVIAPLVQV